MNRIITILIFAIISTSLIGSKLIASPIIYIYPKKSSFKNTAIGFTYTRGFFIQNNLDEDLYIDSLRLEKKSDVLEILDNGQEKFPIVIKKDEEVRVWYKFSPKNENEIENNIIIFSEDTSVAYNITAKGEKFNPVLTVSEEKLDFGRVLINKEEELLLELENVGNGSVTINNIYLKNEDSDFIKDKFFKAPAYIWDDPSLYSIRFKSSELGVHNNELVITSNSNDNKEIRIPLVVEVVEILSSVLEFPQTDELKLNIQPNGDNIEFTIQSNISLKVGKLDVYSTDGMIIRSFKVNRNSYNLHFNINKNELPPLSIISFTQGEKVYTYMYMRE